MFLVLAGIVLALYLFVMITSKVTGAMIHLLLIVAAVLVLVHFLSP